MKSIIKTIFIALPLLCVVSCGNIEKTAVHTDKTAASSVTVSLFSARTAAPSVSALVESVQDWSLTLENADDSESSSSTGFSLSKDKTLLSFVSDFVHNRPQKINVFFLKKFEFVMRQMLSYGGMYFFRTTGFSISKSIISEIFCRSGIISIARSLSSCMT